MLENLQNFAGYKYVKQLIFRYIDDDLAAMSAQTTYYLILAFFPFLFFLINLLSFTTLSNRLLFVNFSMILPAETAAIIKNVLIQTVQAKSTTLLLFGMLGSLWASSRGMMSIIRGLNHSYGIKETRHFIKLNAIAFISTLGLSVMIILSLFMIVFGRIIGSYVFGLIGAKTLFYSIWSYSRYGISLALMVATFYILYRYLPNRKLKSKNIMLGTAFTTVGWLGASLAFSVYINRFANYELIYGSLGGIFALIIWLYISTLIFLLGGGINAISSDFKDKG
jgi:membrane protein